VRGGAEVGKAVAERPQSKALRARARAPVQTLVRAQIMGRGLRCAMHIREPAGLSQYEFAGLPQIHKNAYPTG
jgi:hypothetical protein